MAYTTGKNTSNAAGKTAYPFAGQAAIMLCAVFWSFNGVLIKLIDWPPMLIAGGRSFLAALLLLALRFISAKRPHASTQKKSIGLLLLGSVNYAATMIFFVIANKLTSSANAILLQYTAPVWAALLGWLFLKEKPNAEHWGALVLVGIGMFLFFRHSIGGGHITGDSIALVSGVLFGAHTVILRKAKEQNPADIMIGSNLVAALFSIPFFIMSPPSLTISNIAGISVLGFVQIGISSALFAYGIQRVTVIQTVLITLLEPVLNPVWVLLFTGERPPAAVIAGGSVILFSIILSSVITRMRDQGTVTQSALRRRS